MTKTWQERVALSNGQWPDDECMKAEIDELREAFANLHSDYDIIEIDRDELKAKLAALDSQEPVAWLLTEKVYGLDAETWDQKTVCLTKFNEDCEPLFLAAGAAPALLTASEKTQMWRDATIALCSHENCYLRGIADAERYYLAAGAAPVPEGWQPIETAPKDGLPFRAYSKDLIDLDFNPNGSVECCWDGAEFVGCVWDGQQDAWYGKAISFTHWMLLPSAPKEQTP